MSGVIEAGVERVEKKAGGRARLQIILLLAGALGLDGGDKAMVSAVAGGLEHAFHIGHVEIGLLIAASSLVGAVFTLPAGALVDFVYRNRLLMIAVALWIIATAATGAATSYAFLLGAQLAVGLLTAVVSPVIASLVGDFFPARARASAYGLILAGELIGTGVGFVFGAEISSALDWRWPFWLAAAPGILYLLAIWLWLPEPDRGGQSWIEFGETKVPSREDSAEDKRQRQLRHEDEEQGELSEASRIVAEETGAEPRRHLVTSRDPTRLGLFAAIGYLLRIPTYTLLIIASSLAYYFFGSIRAFGMIYFTQHYGVARSILGGVVVIVGICAITGAVGSGYLSERLLQRGWPRIRIVLPGIALFATALCWGGAIYFKDIWIGGALACAGALGLGAANPPIDAARLDIVLPNMWGRGEGGRMALRGVLEGGAPLLTGLVSVWLAGPVSGGILNGNAKGLEWAMLLMLIPLLVASLLAIPLSRTYPRDVATARESFAAIKEREGRSKSNLPPPRAQSSPPPAQSSSPPPARPTSLDRPMRPRRSTTGRS